VIQLAERESARAKLPLTKPISRPISERINILFRERRIIILFLLTTIAAAFTLGGL